MNSKGVAQGAQPLFVKAPIASRRGARLSTPPIGLLFHALTYLNEHAFRILNPRLFINRLFPLGILRLYEAPAFKLEFCAGLELDKIRWVMKRRTEYA